MKVEPPEKRFYLTPTHPCSYLPGREAQTLFLDPRETVTSGNYRQLTDLGFRRSGAHLYRPHCTGCSACVPTRIPVDDFKPSRNQRRTLRRNADLTFDLVPATYSERAFALYERYIALRHADGDMYPASPEQFKTFLLSQWANTWFLTAHLGKQLVAVAVLDELDHGLSAIYTYFEPTESRRSLGKLMILKEIELAGLKDLPFLYLGYWIKDCEKMRYKTEYRPVEVFVRGRWLKLM